MARIVKKLCKALRLCLERPSRVVKGLRVLVTEGPGSLMQKAYRVAADDDPRKKRLPAPEYADWYLRHASSEKERQRQRREEIPGAPLFGLLVPVREEETSFLVELIQNLQGQTYLQWEAWLLLDRACPEFSLPQGDERLHCLVRRPQETLWEGLAALAREAGASYVGFLHPQDRLDESALYACASALAAGAADVLYTDEDRLTPDRQSLCRPSFKPDWNLELLRSENYIGDFFLIRTPLLEAMEGLRAKVEEGFAYDLLLRAAEQQAIFSHLPRVLYHRGAAPVFCGNRELLQEHYDRLGLPVRVSESRWPGVCEAAYLWEDEPLLSIVIPNKDHVRELDACIRSIEERSSYCRYEYIIVENNSKEEETFAYYQRLQEELPHAHVITYTGAFNYSAINNLGVTHAQGEYLLLLNNDTELIEPDSFSRMLGLCRREDVGAVGALLFYPDDTIQHAGVILGLGSLAGPAFAGVPRDETGMLSRIVCVQEYRAVTAACLMVKRSLYEAVGGMSPELAVAFNDVDFCMKLGALGKRILYQPGAQLYHYESKSRGIEDSLKKVARFNEEVKWFRERWPEAVAQPDPCYNPNLSLERSDFVWGK